MTGKIKSSKGDPEGAGSLRPDSTGEILWKFVREVSLAAIIFLLIAAAAVSLNLMARYLESVGVSEPIVWALKTTEYIIFFIDLLLFVTYILRSAFDMFRKL